MPLGVRRRVTLEELRSPEAAQYNEPANAADAAVVILDMSMWGVRSVRDKAKDLVACVKRECECLINSLDSYLPARW